MTIIHDAADTSGNFSFEFWYLDKKPIDTEGSFKGINVVKKDVTGK